MQRPPCACAPVIVNDADAADQPVRSVGIAAARVENTRASQPGWASRCAAHGRTRPRPASSTSPTPLLAREVVLCALVRLGAPGRRRVPVDRARRQVLALGVVALRVVARGVGELDRRERRAATVDAGDVPTAASSGPIVCAVVEDASLRAPDVHEVGGDQAPAPPGRRSGARPRRSGARARRSPGIDGRSSSADTRGSGATSGETGTGGSGRIGARGVGSISSVSGASRCSSARELRADRRASRRRRGSGRRAASRARDARSRRGARARPAARRARSGSARARAGARSRRSCRRGRARRRRARGTARTPSA